MADTQTKEYMRRLDSIRGQIRDALGDLTPEELTYATESAKFYTVRRMLLLLTTHVEEHTTQLDAAREAIGAGPTMPQRILGRTEEAAGEFLAAMMGLDDAQLNVTPEPGEWSAREVIEHVISVQEGVLKQILAARGRMQVSERQ